MVKSPRLPAALPRDIPARPIGLLDLGYDVWIGIRPEDVQALLTQEALRLASEFRARYPAPAVIEARAEPPKDNSSAQKRKNNSPE